jgi:hypothetical protein
MAKLNADIVGLEVNGDVRPLKQGTASIDFGGKVRTPQLGPNRVIGPANQFSPATFSGTVALLAGEDPRAIYDFDDGQIKITTDQGDEYVMNQAMLTTTLNWSAGEGDMTVEYSGNPWEKL